MPRTIKVLHVEDDEFQRGVIAHQLASLPEFAFSITAAESEEQAVAQFAREPSDLVILDYHLAEGNGLSCLKKLRQQDRIVPIVAVSGVATPEIAAELLRVGADDYLSKQDLQPEQLAQSIRNAVARADAWHHQTESGVRARVPRALLESFADLCRQFGEAFSPELLARLDAFEAAATAAQVSAEQLQAMFAAARAGQTGDTSEKKLPEWERRLRPLLLEILLRLFPETPDADE